MQARIVLINKNHGLLDSCFYSVFLVDTGDPNQHMAVAGEFGRHRLYKMLGYFSLVGLLRLHSLLGDYHQALQVIENMNVNRKVVS